jgi:hypothetical protein
MTSVETVLRFLDAINWRDADILAALMTNDHVLSFSGGCRRRTTGLPAWRPFSDVPD